MKSCIAACFWGENALPGDQCQSPESPGLAWAGQEVLNPRAPGAELPVLHHLPSCAPLDGPLGCSVLLLLLPLRRPTWPHAAFTSRARGKTSFHHWAASTDGTGTAALCSDFSRPAWLCWHRSYLVNNILVCFQSHPAHLVF